MSALFYLILIHDTNLLTFRFFNLYFLTLLLSSSFDYSRGHLKQLISNLNVQKDKIKKSGITVDGKKYCVKFTGIVLAQLVEVTVHQTTVLVSYM